MSNRFLNWILGKTEENVTASHCAIAGVHCWKAGPGKIVGDSQPCECIQEIPYAERHASHMLIPYGDEI